MRRAIKLVSVGPDRYAIRRGLFIREYKDLTSSFWWGRSTSFFEDCVGPYSEVKPIFDSLCCGDVVHERGLANL